VIGGVEFTAEKSGRQAHQLVCLRFLVLQNFQETSVKLTFSGKTKVAFLQMRGLIQILGIFHSFVLYLNR